MIGIIGEYNPFHNGHLYHINKIKEMFPNKIICLVLVGNFLNRGDISIIEKYDKAMLALEYGVDLVVELPTCFAIQSADIYAMGAVGILNHLKCNYLVFGSESNDLNSLKKIAASQNNSINIDEFVKKGYNYPTCLALALKKHTGKNISTPNDLLGISYIKAINKLRSEIEPITIKRTNDYHDFNLSGKISSATSIRKLIKENKSIKNYVPDETLKYIKNIDLNDYYFIIKYKITTEDLTKYHDIDFNLNNAFKKNIDKANNIEELIKLVKCKNYTYNRIKRCLVHILCYLKEENYIIEYIHILGFNLKGKNYLNKIKKDIKIPLITNYNKLLDYQILTDKIYHLFTNDFKINKPIFKN